MNKKAVVLLSGGLDSATVLAIAKDLGYECYCLSFSYGQRHDCEIQAAKKVFAANKGKLFKIVEIDLRAFGGSALTDDIDVPKASSNTGNGEPKIPVTYVPARNIIFLSYALGFAEVNGCNDIFLGVNAVDYSGYPDCRPEFITSFEQTANLGTKAGVEGNGFNIQTPIINLSKADIIKKGVALGVDYSLTHSCYNPSPEGLSCGECDSCSLRMSGFKDAGVEDPTRYI